MTMTETLPTATRARASQPTTPRKAATPRLRRWLAPALVAVVTVAAWWMASVLADSAVFPTPGESLATLREDLADPRDRQSIADTLRVLAVSFLVAAVVGSVLGMLLGLSAFWSQAVLPVVYATNSIPKITLYPIFLLFLGIDDLSRGAFAFVSGVLPMFLITCEATAGVSRINLKLAASLRLGWPALLARIVLPSIAPSLVAGLRLTFGLTFLGLLLAEMFSGSSGLGYELLRNVTLVRMENIMGEVVLVGVLALVPTLLLEQAERRARRHFEGIR
jgi:NitT/TauT family transport system permease protein